MQQAGLLTPTLKSGKVRKSAMYLFIIGVLAFLSVTHLDRHITDSWPSLNDKQHTLSEHPQSKFWLRKHCAGVLLERGYLV